jgi:DNA polymerase-3 subunit delta'
VSAAEGDVGEPPHPRITTAFFGHDAAERVLLDAYRSGSLPHAWLIGGPKGIGKATLAYRMASFVLAHPDPAAPEVLAAQSLALADEHPVVRRVAMQGHGGLFVLERTEGETGKLRTRIAIEDVRRMLAFFGSTAGEGGWRVAIVDAVDELNNESANALLKVLEEPPRRALLVLVSHAAGRVMPTIRSRCRMLALRPLSVGETAQAAAAALGRAVEEPAIVTAAEAADGSAARALMLLHGPALALRTRILDLVGQLPLPDARALHALGDALAGTEPTTLAAFVDTVNAWLETSLHRAPADPDRLVRLATAWEKINTAARDAHEYNLDRKPLVFNVFGLLAEATRG